MKKKQNKSKKTILKILKGKSKKKPIDYLSNDYQEIIDNIFNLNTRPAIVLFTIDDIKKFLEKKKRKNIYDKIEIELLEDLKNSFKKVVLEKNAHILYDCMISYRYMQN